MKQKKNVRANSKPRKRWSTTQIRRSTKRRTSFAKRIRYLERLTRKYERFRVLAMESIRRKKDKIAYLENDVQMLKVREKARDTVEKELALELLKSWERTTKVHCKYCLDRHVPIPRYTHRKECPINWALAVEETCQDVHDALVLWRDRMRKGG